MGFKDSNVSDLVVTPEAEKAAGCVTYWRASGTVSIEALSKAWAAAGLDVGLLRKAPEPAVAFRRAVMAQQRRHRLVRALKEAHTWVIVDEHVHKPVEGQPAQPPTYTKLCIVRCDFDGRNTVEVLDGDPSTVDAIQTCIRADFMQQQGLFDPGDITGWLVKMAYGKSAVTLRDSGGVYFIPRPAMEFWTKAADVVETVSHKTHRVFRIPAMKNSEAVEAIVDAMTAEAEQIAKEVEDDIASGKLGGRALESRRGALEALLKKVGSYEELIGQQIKVQDRIATVSSAVAQAILVANVESDEAAA